MYPTSNVQVIECVMCDDPASYFYPAPMCRCCHNDWAE